MTTNERAVARVFQLWSKFYDHPVPQRLFYRRVHQRILRRWHPARGERVLDVGCGTGLFVGQLAREFNDLELHGLDLSAHMLAEARRTTPGANFVEGSVYALPFADASFDVALNTISCHFYLEQVRAFREIARVLRPGGRFLCAAITFAPLLASAVIAGVAVYHPRRVLEAHLREASFTVVAAEHIVPGTTLFDARRN